MRTVMELLKRNTYFLAHNNKYSHESLRTSIFMWTDGRYVIRGNVQCGCVGFYSIAVNNERHFYTKRILLQGQNQMPGIILICTVQ